MNNKYIIKWREAAAKEITCSFCTARHDCCEQEQEAEEGVKSPPRTPDPVTHNSLVLFRRPRHRCEGEGFFGL